MAWERAKTAKCVCLTLIAWELGALLLLPAMYFLSSSYASENRCLSPLLLVSCCCQFCRLFVSTVEQCETAVLERLESNAKLKRQNFGSQSYSPPKSSSSAAASQAAATVLLTPETPQTDSDTPFKKGTTCDMQTSFQRVAPEFVSNLYWFFFVILLKKEKHKCTQEKFLSYLP